MEQGGKKRLIRKLKNKYRLVVLNDSTFEEKVSLRLSPLNVFTIVGSFALFLILSVAVLIVFTPIREFIPGYTDVDLRSDVLNLTIKSDSVERDLQLKQAYLNNLYRLLSDDPIKEEQLDFIDSGRDYNNITIEKTAKDSLLRAYVENEDQFNLSIRKDNQPKKFSISNFAFFTPLSGSVTWEFSPEINHFGVDIVAPENEAIKSCLDGTVVFAEWTAGTGYVIQVQHKSNLLSIYKHNAVLLKTVGEFVKAGEAIAIIGNSGELTTGPHLHFELWYEGNPINPKEYILF